MVRMIQSGKFRFGCLILAVLALATCPAAAEPVDVVTQDGAKIASLSREQVADLFLGKARIVFEGLELTPLEVNDEPLREVFYQGVAGMSAMRVNAYWARLVFTSQGRPPRKLNLSDAERLVRSRPGFVTYVPSDDSNGFRILLTVH